MDYGSFQEIAKRATADQFQPKMIRFEYTKKDGSHETYLVEPYEIAGEYFWGFKVVEGGGIRKFFISMIDHAAVVEDQSYTPRWPLKI